MHPWVWLNEPQHSAAVQAVAAMIFGLASIIVAVYSLKYLVRASLAADAQVVAATTQAEAAREQIVLARAQIKENVLPRFELRREEDDRPWTSYGMRLFLTNVGAGSAKDITIFYYDEGELLCSETGFAFLKVPPRHEFELLIRSGGYRAMHVFFSSAEGTRYVVMFSFSASGSLYTLNCEVKDGDEPLASQASMNSNQFNDLQLAAFDKQMEDSAAE